MISKVEEKRLVQLRYLKDLLLVLAGVASATVGLKGFLLPNNFLDGGVTGISLLAQILTGMDVSIFIVLLNLPFIFIGIRQISLNFALKSAFAIFLLAVVVHFIYFPIITQDKLLIAVFGGFFLGGGIGLSIRGGAVIDGTEVLAIFASKYTSLTVGDFITLFNATLFCVAAMLTSIETAMYSMLTYFTAAKTVDFIINGIEEYICVTIVSKYADEVRHAVAHDLGRGITVLEAQGGYGKKGGNSGTGVLLCVVTRLEVTQLLLEIEKVDAEAFIIQHSVKDTKGGMIKRRPLH